MYITSDNRWGVDGLFFGLWLDPDGPVPAALAGSIVEFFGTGGHNLIGPEDERWDLAMIVRQASVQDLFAFAANGEYLAGIGHRTAALEDSRLLPIVHRPLPLSPTPNAPKT
jgi:hypothetical protein